MTADRTSSELSELIRENAGIDLTSIHEYLASTVGPTRMPTTGRGPSIVAPSVELDDVTVTVSVWSTDPSLLGTFDRAAETQMVQVAINARSNAVMTLTGARRRAVRLPVQEQIAWARVVLENLSDYAYRIVTDWEILRIRPAFFIVLVANDGSPQLAPSDFTWILASSGGRRAYPEKLVPEDPNLLAHLRRHGDLINADLVPRPQASPPQVWAQQFVSHLTAAVADELGRMGNSQWFTFDEVSLHGANRVIVRYTWHLAEGDKQYRFDIDLAGVREQRLQALDDPRASSAAETIGLIPFDQPVFRAPTVIDGVTWIRFGASE